MLMEAGHVAQNIQLQAVALGLGSVTIGGFNARAVSKVCTLTREFEPIYVIPVGYIPGAPADETFDTADRLSPAAPAASSGPRVALVIPSVNFRDEELAEMQKALNQAGIESVIVGRSTGPVTGMLGTTADAQIAIADLSVNTYDAIVFIGGIGTAEYINDPAALKIARQAAEQQKVLATGDIAPTILANAGLLKDKKATAYVSERQSLTDAGAEYTGELVERDGLIITSNGQKAAVPFARAVVTAVKQNTRKPAGRTTPKP
jgi:protease I